MHLTFSNAPLVEIIAELRWAQPHALLQAGQTGAVAVPMSIIGSNSKMEEFFMRFGGAVYQLGFESAERLVPPAFPIPPGQPVYRYKPVPHRSLMSSALLQVGPGIFSANAIPPYKSWTEFEPVVARGTQALLETRDPAEKASTFTGASLRYIDAFGPTFLGGMSPGEFIHQVLGFSAAPPASVTAQMPEGNSARAQLQFVIPIRENMTMRLAVGEGMFNNEAAAIMDTSVSADREVNPDVDSVMATLRAARETIHAAFIGMTDKIHDRMQPTQEA